MKDIKNIVAKRVLGDTLTNEEDSILRRWVDNEPSNALLLEKLKTFELSKVIIEVEDEDLGCQMSEQFIRSIKSIKTKRRRVTRIKIACAGVAAAFLAISWLLFDGSKPMESILVTNEGAVISSEVVKQEESIQLITANKVINLYEEINLLAETVAVDSIGEEYEPIINTLVVPLRKEYNFVLPDGSKVWINSNSRLMFPDKFSDTLRSVELIGEAYFEVVKNDKSPFVVKTRNISTTVLGTEFMVSCYEDKNEVSLVKGSIEVNKTGSRDRITLKPGRGVVLKDGSSDLQEVAINSEKVFGRKNGLIVYDEELLVDIVADLKNIYGVDFVFENEMLKNQTFYVKIKRQDSIEDIMQLLRCTKKINYTIKENTIFIKPFSL